MSFIKINSKVDDVVWKNLHALAGKADRGISGLLAKAIRDYMRKHRIRPEVLNHLEASIRENEELGRRFAE